MSYFLNYNTNTGLSIDTGRDPNATVGDIGDLALAVENGNENITCSVDFGDGEYASTIDVLESGEYWQGMSISQETLEEIHALVSSI